MEEGAVETLADALTENGVDKQQTSQLPVSSTTLIKDDAKDKSNHLPQKEVVKMKTCSGRTKNANVVALKVQKR